MDNLDVDAVIGCVGDGINKLLERVLNNPNDSQLQGARKYFDEFYSKHLMDNTILYPGMLTVLQHFSEKEMAVISNKAQHYTDNIIDQLNIKKYFKSVLGGRTDLNKKPAPDTILFILEKLSIEPQKAVIIGDTRNDILAGKAAGIRTCAVTYGFRSIHELKLTEPDFIAKKAPDLINILS
jgi:phosphoglycolate phosphatase